MKKEVNVKSHIRHLYGGKCVFVKAHKSRYDVTDPNYSIAPHGGYDPTSPRVVRVKSKGDDDYSGKEEWRENAKWVERKQY